MLIYSVHRQIGDYVIYSRGTGRTGVAPFFVRMAGDDMPLSTHWSVTDAVAAIAYRRADDLRRRYKALDTAAERE